MLRLVNPIRRVGTFQRSSLTRYAYSTGLRPTEKEVAPGIAQSPNRPSTWAPSQQPKEEAMVGPRFEQIDLNTQPNAMSAMELIDEVPIRFVDKRVASCDGGGGPLGHPKVYINLDKPGAHPCGYCGIRFQKTDDHHH